MFKLSAQERDRMRARDHVELLEPPLDRAMAARLLRDVHCPIDSVPALLRLVRGRGEAFRVQYSTATKRNPDVELRRRYCKLEKNQVRQLHAHVSTRSLPYKFCALGQCPNLGTSCKVAPRAATYKRRRK